MGRRGYKSCVDTLARKDDGTRIHRKEPDLCSSNSIAIAGSIDSGEAQYSDLSSCEVLSLAAEEAKTSISPFAETDLQLA